MTVTPIDPFGQWPAFASAIAGLRDGIAPRHPGYAFHTPYTPVNAGPATFRVRMTGLHGAGGRVVLRLQSTRRRGSGRVERRVSIRLRPDIPVALDVPIRFDARTDREYAVHARCVGARDAHAEAVAVSLDHPLLAGSLLNEIDAQADAIRARAARPAPGLKSWRSLDRLGLMRPGIATLADPVSQMCTAAQFEEPAYRRWVNAIDQPWKRHRKQWEFVYILAILDRYGKLRPGRRGLGFGAGDEPLPAAMAARDVEIVATDIPFDERLVDGWTDTSTHVPGLDPLWRPGIVDRDRFYRNTRFRAVDMNRIPADLVGFDFCWSACAFEHLGSIDAGLAFVENSLATLKPGGVAVHTTELNLSSNQRTLEKGITVLFRWRDFERLARRLRRLGHHVLPICLDYGDRPLDRHIDMPPYRDDTHLKLALYRYATTSFGIAVIKNRLQLANR